MISLAPEPTATCRKHSTDVHQLGPIALTTALPLRVASASSADSTLA